MHGISSAGTAPTSVSLSGKGLACGLGIGLALIGAGIGFGMIGRAAMDAMARQPEVAPRIQTGMLIIAAMLEGAALAAVVLSFVLGNGASMRHGQGRVRIRKAPDVGWKSDCR